jgi:type II secretion system protein H
VSVRPQEIKPITGNAKPGTIAMRNSKKQGFSLIELILVAMVIGVSTAIVFPMVSRSMRGSRLRAAARSIVMLGRYARSMAVLDQETLHLQFDRESGSVAAVSQRTGATLKSRTLDGVRIVALELDRPMTANEASESVENRARYLNNGACTPYRVELEDESGQQAAVIVDRFGTARTETP